MNSWRLVNKKVDKTLLKSIENVKILLYYNIGYQKQIQNINSQAISLSSLESVPLAVNQNETLTVFSYRDKLIIHDEPNLFRNQEHRFLHIRLNSIFNQEQIHFEYFRPMSIQDLDILLPSILDPYTYLNNSEYVEALEFRIKECEEAWKQIERCLTPNRNNIYQLEPIKNWSLIPVRKSSGLFLAPIKDHGIILKPVEHDNLIIFTIFNEIDYPVIDKSMIPDECEKLGDILDSIVVSLSKNENLLYFFRSQKDCYEKIFAKDENKRNILKELSKCIKEVWSESNRDTVLKFMLSSPNSIDECRIRIILRNLPIYEDIFERFEALCNIESYCIDISKLPTIIKENAFHTGSAYYEDLYDFANHMTLHIMKNRSYSVLFFIQF